jgi:hypothetical protein
VTTGKRTRGRKRKPTVAADASETADERGIGANAFTNRLVERGNNKLRW